MPADAALALDRAKQALTWRKAEAERLDLIHKYLRDDPDEKLPWLPADAPIELQRLARLSRVNVLQFIVGARSQSLYADGYRTPKTADDEYSWEAWRRNRMTARQIGIHRAALSYGAAYGYALPGTPLPVIRGASPRGMTDGYCDDDERPEYALLRRRSAESGKPLYRLIDDTYVWYVRTDTHGESLEIASDPLIHGARVDGMPVCPVVRYRETDDLDCNAIGIVEPYLLLQDQINVTSFGLQVAQHFGAFKQRSIGIA